MQVRNTPRRWGSVQQTLHWTIVMLVVAQLAMGFVIGLGHGPTVDRIQNFWHASIGILIFGLMTLRLLWREVNPTPSMPSDVDPWLAAFARFTHFAFYALLILDPVLGYFTGCAHGDNLSFFGLQLPHLIGKDKALGHTLVRAHWDFGYAIIACVVVHAAGALQHEFIRRDNVLRRMLPGTPLRPDREAEPELGQER
jgi:cytochrome b561